MFVAFFQALRCALLKLNSDRNVTSNPNDLFD